MEEYKRHSVDHIEKSDYVSVNIKSKEVSMDGFFDEIITIKVDNKYWI